MFDFQSVGVFTLDRLAMVRAQHPTVQNDQFFAQFHLSQGRMMCEAL
jgi:hypothetical protein